VVQVVAGSNPVGHPTKSTLGSQILVPLEQMRYQNGRSPMIVTLSTTRSFG